MSPSEVIVGSAADADLLTRVGIALTLQFRSSLRSVHAVVVDGEVTLSGILPSFHDRQLAIALVRHIAGVRRVHDRLIDGEVRRRARGVAVAKRWDGVTGSEQNHSHATATEGLPIGAAARLARLRDRAASLLASAIPRGVVAVLAVAAISGCGRTDSLHVPVYPTNGTISFRGQPIPGAIVTLHPSSSTGENVPTPRASVAGNGTFTVSTYDGGDGAPVGEYTVTVVWFKPIVQEGELRAGPNVIPRKFARPQTSDLRVKIASGDNIVPAIKL
jgi:BON domain